jgi:hypothetical protein
MAEFPPPPAPVSPTPTDNAATIAAILAIERDLDDEPTELDDVFWVYDHIGSDGLAPEDFPGLGAWSMWKWARDNRARFYETLWPRAEAADALWGDHSPEADVAAPQLSREELCWMWQERLAEGLASAMGEVTKHALWVLDLASDEPAPISKQQVCQLAGMVSELGKAHIEGQGEFRLT